MGKLRNLIGDGITVATEYNRHRQSRSTGSTDQSSRSQNADHAYATYDQDLDTRPRVPPNSQQYYGINSDYEIDRSGRGRRYQGEGSNNPYRQTYTQPSQVIVDGVYYPRDPDTKKSPLTNTDYGNIQDNHPQIDYMHQDWKEKEYNEKFGAPPPYNPAPSNERAMYSDVPRASSHNRMNANYPDPQMYSNQSRLSPNPTSGLPLPVIIPQRRPGNRNRGFALAYAPLLQTVGISEPTFLDFLQGFNANCEASPWFQVVNVSAGIAGFAPSATAQIVLQGVQIGAQIGSSVQEKFRTNNFLSKANATLFQPAGLFAAIMTYNPDAAAGGASNQPRKGLISGATNGAMGMMTSGAQGGKFGNFMQQASKDISSGTTNGECELPESAPLVFVDPIEAREADAQGEEPQGFMGKAKDFGHFYSTHLDNKAQQQFATDNPMSRLSRSAGSSPGPSNSSAPQGNSNPLSDFRSSRHDRKRDKRSRRRDRRRGGGSSSSDSSSDDEGGRGRNGRRSGRRDQRKSGGGGLKGRMKQGTLYLLIANLPPERELERARQEMNAQGMMS